MFFLPCNMLIEKSTLTVAHKYAGLQIKIIMLFDLLNTPTNS